MRISKKISLDLHVFVRHTLLQYVIVFWLSSMYLHVYSYTVMAQARYKYGDTIFGRNTRLLHCVCKHEFHWICAASVLMSDLTCWAAAQHFLTTFCEIPLFSMSHHNNWLFPLRPFFLLLTTWKCSLDFNCVSLSNSVIGCWKSVG